MQQDLQIIQHVVTFGITLERSPLPLESPIEQGYLQPARAPNKVQSPNNRGVKASLAGPAPSGSPSLAASLT